MVPFPRPLGSSKKAHRRERDTSQAVSGANATPGPDAWNCWKRHLPQVGDGDAWDGTLIGGPSTAVSSRMLRGLGARHRMGCTHAAPSPCRRLLTLQVLSLGSFPPASASSRYKGIDALVPLTHPSAPPHPLLHHLSAHSALSAPDKPGRSQPPPDRAGSSGRPDVPMSGGPRGCRRCCFNMQRPPTLYANPGSIRMRWSASAFFPHAFAL